MIAPPLRQLVPLRLRRRIEKLINGIVGRPGGSQEPALEYREEGSERSDFGVKLGVVHCVALCFQGCSRLLVVLTEGLRGGVVEALVAVWAFGWHH